MVRGILVLKNQSRGLIFYEKIMVQSTRPIFSWNFSPVMELESTMQNMNSACHKVLTKTATVSDHCEQGPVNHQESPTSKRAPRTTIIVWLPETALKNLITTGAAKHRQDVNTPAAGTPTQHIYADRILQHRYNIIGRLVSPTHYLVP